MNVLIDWTVTQVFHNGTHKVSGGGVPAEVSCPYLGCAYKCAQTHTMRGLGGEEGWKGKGERKNPSNVVFDAAFTQFNTILNMWKCRFESFLKVFEPFLKVFEPLIHIGLGRWINKQEITEEFIMHINTVAINLGERMCGSGNRKCGKQDERIKVKASHSHAYLALFDDPLDGIWHHLWVEFQAATQHSETWDVATAVTLLATGRLPSTAGRDREMEIGSTHLRCRSMLAALSNMAVGLAIFLPTAWAKGWRAPWKRSGIEKREGMP